MNRANALRTRYDGWLAAKVSPCAEIMTGIHSGTIKAFRLDHDGLQAHGFPNGLPADFVPERLMAGGYDEDRAIYDSPVFSKAGAEPRSLHMALDIFAAPATPVFAPLDGRVHSFQDNAATQDYGPTLILEHSPLPHLSFWTLYGHLSRDSLSSWHVGRALNAGDQLGTLGRPEENGGWAPHLHVQVILDIGDNRGDFPGVFKHSERHFWRQLCPDPAPLLGIVLS